MRDLTPLFEPRSVALVGASNDRMKWGGWFAISLLGQAGHPPISMVSRRAGDSASPKVPTSTVAFPPLPSSTRGSAG